MIHVMCVREREVVYLLAFHRVCFAMKLETKTPEGSKHQFFNSNYFLCGLNEEYVFLFVYMVQMYYL